VSSAESQMISSSVNFSNQATKFGCSFIGAQNRNFSCAWTSCESDYKGSVFEVKPHPSIHYCYSLLVTIVTSCNAEDVLHQHPFDFLMDFIKNAENTRYVSNMVNCDGYLWANQNNWQQRSRDSAVPAVGMLPPRCNGLRKLLQKHNQGGFLPYVVC
jgi:hypothetical protein